MKQEKLKGVAIILITILMLSSMTIISKAAGSFTSSISKTTVTEGDTLTVTAKATGAAGKYSVTSSNTSVVSISTSQSGFLDNSSETWTLKANKAGTSTITVKTTDMTDNDDDTKVVTGSKTYTVTVKAKSTSGGSTGGGSSSGGGTTPTAPKFTSANKKVYTTGSVNLRSSWSTSSTATQVAKGTELTLTGTSTEKINGYVWYKVTYKGATKYIANSLVTTTKPEEEKPEENDNKNTDKSSNKALSSLSIEGIEITPKFDKETTQYTATVGGDVTELKIDAKADDSKAKVEIEGNENLKEGDNVIKVKVTAEDDTTRTYFITVTQGEGVATDNELKLSDLQIKGINFGNGFSPDTHTYELNLSTYVQNLEITATPNKEGAKVEIAGNSDFKEGKNTVVILLTSADGTQTATYQIEVTLSSEVVAKAEKTEENMPMYIICGVVVAVAIVAIVIFVLRYRTTRQEDNDNEDFDEKDFVSKQYEEKPQTRKKESKEEAELPKEEEKASRRKKSEVSVDEFLDNSEAENKPKKPRGRHSV